jgi:hypothetical protein
MAFIGNTVQNQGFTPAIDYFNGNGVTVTFTLSRPIASVAQVIVAVDNVIQNPSSAFNVVGNSITFTSAPLSGTNNIWVEYTSLITTYQGISQDPTVIGDIRATGGYLAEGDFGNSFIDGNLIDYVTGRGRFTVGELDDITFYHGGTSGRSEMMDLYYAGGAKIYGTTALTIPVGTTAERPGTPATGMIRMNTTTGYPEWYSSATSAWVSFNQAIPYTATYLIVGGGGAGGCSQGGGGGAGGFLTSTTLLNPGTVYSFVVGSGGSGNTSTNTVGGSGNNSTAFGLTASGGGGGGGGNRSGATAVAGASGGSGGGGSGSYNAVQSGGAGTSGQGNTGGSGFQDDSGNLAELGGGGGGASAVGGNYSTTSNGVAGNGGAGTASSITGSSVTYAGGGGGGVRSDATSAGSGGAGGGGNGVSGASAGGNGTANRGGGGGGGGGQFGSGTIYAGGNGGSGVVILSIPTANYTGTTTGSPTVTTSGSNTILQFNSSGSYTA